MNGDVYRFELEPSVPLDEAEMTLQLAILGSEGLYGGARVRMDVGYHVDEAKRTVVLDAGTDVGNSVVQMYTAFLTREFGEDAFKVRRAYAQVPQTTSEQRA